MAHNMLVELGILLNRYDLRDDCDFSSKILLSKSERLLFRHNVWKGF